MKIFPQEKSISDLILGSNAVSLYSESKLTESFAIASADVETQSSDELYYTKSILVTTNWNKNDDIFLPEETWAARKTPVNKPTNLSHNQDKIIGHITSQWIIDAEGNMIDDSDDANMPDLFHICNGAVIYKFLPNRSKEISDEVEQLIEGIEANEKFVSMEALFRWFDYAVIDEDGTSFNIVERKSDTAFLSKYLRAYGGDGVYGNKKIGRILRKISFSGKGYVDKPANPESIIFSFANLNIDLNKSGVYISRGTNKEELSNMSLELLQKQLDEAKAEVEKLKGVNTDLQTQVAKVNVEKYEKEIAELKSVNEDLNSQISVANEKIENLTSVKAENENTIKALGSEKAELEKTLATIKQESVSAKRVSMLVEAGVAKDVATAKVAKFINLNDEQFEDIANTVIDLVKASSNVLDETNDVLDNATKESESASAGAIDTVDENSERQATIAALQEVFENFSKKGKK
jgi:hypothetical protein